MNCRKCEKSISADSRFCKYCGVKTTKPAIALSATRPKRRAKRQLSNEPEPDVHGDPRQEQPIWEGRPAWRSFYGAWLLWMLLSLACLLAAYHYAGLDSPLVAVVWLFAGGAAAAVLVREAMVVYGLSYQLTTQRLFIHRGILTRVTDQVELLRIDDVRLRQGIVDRLVNTGNLDVFSSDETDETITLQSIFAPVDLAESLRLHVRAVRNKGAVAVERI